MQKAFLGCQKEQKKEKELKKVFYFLGPQLRRSNTILSRSIFVPRPHAAAAAAAAVSHRPKKSDCDQASGTREEEEKIKEKERTREIAHQFQHRL